MMKSIGRIWTTFATLTWNFWMNLLHKAVTSIVGPCSRRICSSWLATDSGFSVVSSRTIEIFAPSRTNSFRPLMKSPNLCMRKES